jgi:hypothetical protein
MSSKQYYSFVMLWCMKKLTNSTHQIVFHKLTVSEKAKKFIVY